MSRSVQTQCGPPWPRVLAELTINSCPITSRDNYDMGHSPPGSQRHLQSVINRNEAVLSSGPVTSNKTPSMTRPLYIVMKLLEK